MCVNSLGLPSRCGRPRCERRNPFPFVVILLLVFAGACGTQAGDDVDDMPAWWGSEPPSPPAGHIVRGLAHSGRWAPPAETLAIGDAQDVIYTGAGPWVGSSGCAGGMTPGALTFRNYLYAEFPQAYHVGGYACRAIVGSSSTMSVHATGRALDIMIQTVGGEADNDMGDPIGNWLIENAEEIGIQYIIWDRTSWGAHRPDGNKARYYSGSHPHHDHLHIELSVEAGSRGTAFFAGPMEPPLLRPCQVIPTAGGTLDEVGPCSVAYGPASYWRSVEDAGWGGDLLWTNAFDSSDPSNWGMWSLFFETPGRYRVEAYLEPGYAVYGNTRYVVHAGGDDHALFVDQSASSGWSSLGEFDFGNRGWQYAAVLDNASGPVADDQHVVFDGLRLVPVDVTPCGLIPAAGGVVDEADACFEAHGPSMYWRSVDGAGVDSRLLWTNAFQSDAPSNWARWRLHVETAGDYRVQVATHPTWGVFAQTPYVVRAGGVDYDVVADQSSAADWVELGTFAFAAGGDQSVRVNDSVGFAVASNQHIAVDAVRLIPAVACGDGSCNGNESCESCAVDCGACITCGDGSCNGNESCESCAVDCGACIACGDGSCNGDESCDSCAADCGACSACGDGSCDGAESCADCPADCGRCVACDDGYCDPTEDCDLCPEDCGVCDECPASGCIEETDEQTPETIAVTTEPVTVVGGCAADQGTGRPGVAFGVLFFLGGLWRRRRFSRRWSPCSTRAPAGGRD